MGRKTALFLCGMLVGSAVWLFTRNNHEDFYVHTHSPWQIEIRHDGQKCFAFIMDRETQKHMYVVNCQDTVLITREAENYE